jgi:hypothetical protein
MELASTLVSWPPALVYAVVGLFLLVVGLVVFVGLHANQQIQWTQPTSQTSRQQPGPWCGWAVWTASRLIGQSIKQRVSQPTMDCLVGKQMQHPTTPLTD